MQIGGFGYPSVRRNSPLLEYLNKCDVGCALRSDDLLQVVSYPHCAAVPSVLPQLLRLPTAGRIIDFVPFEVNLLNAKLRVETNG